MENSTPTTPKTQLTYGLISAIILILLFVIFYAFALYTNSAISWIPALVFFILMIIAVNSHSKALKGDVTFGELFSTGFKTTAVTTLITIAFVLIFSLVVPAYKEAIIDQSRDKMIAQNKLTQEQVDTALQMTRRFFYVGLIAFGIIGDLIVGILGSLVGAAISKKNPQKVAS